MRQAQHAADPFIPCPLCDKPSLEEDLRDLRNANSADRAMAKLLKEEDENAIPSVRCYGCGEVYSRREFFSLHAPNHEHGVVGGLYWRNCSCGSTITLDQYGNTVNT